MNNRIGTMVGAVMVALVIVGAGFWGMTRPMVTQAAQANSGYPRSITVVGQGSIKATPDKVTVQVGVQAQAGNSKQAIADNATSMTALMTKLKDLGIAEADIQTSNFSISPVYDQQGRTVTGYQVSNTVSVTIHQINKASDLLDGVVAAGANNIYGLSFGFENADAQQSLARDQAIESARTRAEAMAKAAGATVGQVLTINETVGGAPMPMPMMAMEKSDASGTPISAGAQSIEAQVQVTFELK